MLLLKLFDPLFTCPLYFFDPASPIVFANITHLPGRLFIHNHSEFQIHATTSQVFYPGGIALGFNQY